MGKEFEQRNNFIDNNENIIDEILVDKEDLINDDIYYRKDYDEHYQRVIDNIVRDLNKKSKRKNRIMFMLVTCASLFSFSGGFLVNSYLDNRVIDETKQMNYQVSNDKKNNNSNNNGNNNGGNITGDADIKKGDSKVDEKENLTIEEVVKRVSPSVVTVTVNIQGNMFSPPGQGVGTGFIVDKDGSVVTNYHVIDGATDIVITFNDGREVKAKVVVTSKKDDLAVLDIIDEVEMPGIAELAADDEISAGQDVVAIGNPLGKEFSGTVTKGIISSPKRMVTTEDGTKEYIQIDAAINKGNSGGPLINLKGEIIGVNSAKQSGEGVEGIGFAVAIKYVRDMLENQGNYTNESGQYFGQQPGNGFQGGEYPWGYPGNEFPGYPGGFGNEEPNRRNENINGFRLGVQVVESENGIVVVGVERGSIAEIAGIKINDIIVGLQGMNIKTVNEFKNELSLLQVGQNVELNIQRDGQIMSLMINI